MDVLAVSYAVLSPDMPDLNEQKTGQECIIENSEKSWSCFSENS